MGFGGTIFLFFSARTCDTFLGMVGGFGRVWGFKEGEEEGRWLCSEVARFACSVRDGFLVATGGGGFVFFPV